MLTRKMKDSGIEWIGEIPEDWEVKKVRYFLLERSERNHPDEMVLSLYRDYGVIPKDSRDDNHNVTSLNTASYKLVRKNDLVINKMKAWQGSMGISKYQGIISPAYFIFEVTDNNLNKDFLHYALRNPAYIQEYKRISAGLRVGQWDLNKQEFKNIIYPFPKRKELQLKIVNMIKDKVKRIESIVNETEQSIIELKKYKQSLITEAVTKGIDQNAEMKDSGIEWIGKIPKHWEIKQLKYLTQERKEQLSRNTDKDFILNYVDIGSVTFENGIENFEKLRFQNSPSRARKIVYKNDIIVSTVRTYLKSIARIKNDNEYIVSTGFCVLIPNQNNNPTFIEFLIKADFFTNQVEMNSKGIAYPSITPDKLLSLYVIEPPLCEQNKIVSYLDEQICRLNKIIEDKTKLIEELEAYKKSLIYEYVTGKKEV